MIAPLDDVTARALSLPLDGCARLVRRPMLSLEDEPSTETPEEIAAAPGALRLREGLQSAARGRQS